MRLDITRAAAFGHLAFVLPLTVASPPPQEPPAKTLPTPPDWYKRVSPSEPGAFPVVRSFDADYHLGWGGLQAAQVNAHCVSSPTTHEIHTTFKAATTGAARVLYKLDAIQVSVLNRTTLRPIWLEQTEQNSKKHLLSRVDFSPTGASRRERNLDKSEHDPSAFGKTRQYLFSSLYDMQSVLLYVRSLPLAQGSEMILPLMTANSPYLATIKVLERNRVKVKAGEFPAIECSLQLEKIKKDGTLEPRKGFKSAHAWISDDADRLLVKAESEVFIGSVSLELDQVKFADPAAR